MKRSRHTRNKPKPSARRRLLLAALVIGGAASAFYAVVGRWVEITGAGELTALYSGTTLTGSYEGVDWNAHYCADGTGIATIGDTEAPRKWQVRGGHQVCVETRGETDCWTYARHNLRSGRLRATRASDGVVFYATVEANKPSPCR